jgi:lipid-A-disaccharide synthase
MRAAQQEGFAEVARRMETDRPAGELAAEAVLNVIDGSRGIGE